MGRFHLKVKKDFLTIRIVPLWIQLPCKLGKFSVTRSMASRNQPSLGGGVGIAEGIQTVTFVGPYNSLRLCDSIISPSISHPANFLG